MDDRKSMLTTLAREYRRTEFLTGRGAPDPRVRAAMARLPREQFVPAARVADAYRDAALPIGSGQTISQPFMVALMTELLDPRPDSLVLEIGTGSGYQAAVLSQLVEKVYSVEIIETLARQATRRLARLGCDNVEVKCDDGNRGWPEHAPYDGIIVTAVAPRTPAPLVEQLACGGRLVIPIGRETGAQQLMLIEKDADGRTREHSILAVRFVPLVGTADDHSGSAIN